MKKVFLSRRLLLFWLGAAAVTFRTTILINKAIWNVHSKEVQEALIKHEDVHSRHHLAEPVLFWVKYIFLRKHRLNYEIPTFVVQIKYLVSKKKGTVWQLSRNAATLLSSAMYFWVASYDKVLVELTKRLQE